MSSSSLPSRRLSREELEAESAAALPAKEVLSVPLLDLNVDVDLALALAAPIDLAVAANANAALPIDAAVSANVLSAASTSTALAQQGVMIDQLISGEAIAVGNQDSMIDQTDTSGAGADTGTDGTGTDTGTTGTDRTGADGGTTGTTDVTTDPVQDTVDGVLDAGLLHVDANVHLDADLASPVAGAVAANANVAAPIDAAVSANIASIGSDSVAAADQTAIISQQMPDVTASATATQTAEVDQADTAGALDSGGTADTSGQ